MLASGVAGAIYLTLDNRNDATDRLKINVESKVNMVFWE